MCLELHFRQTVHLNLHLALLQFRSDNDRAPTSAPDTTDTDNVTDDADTDDTTADTPSPENTADTPDWNPEPDTTTERPDTP